MSSFLNNIAQVYIDTFSDKISDFTFVFPNRRTGVFFRRYLAHAAGKPILSPTIVTIEQLFEQFSTLKLVDPTELLFRLYNVYRELYLIPEHKDEPFDNFLFWGRMMLSDFNDVDMHLADADKLFTNFSDIKNIELRFSDLNEEQQQALRSFIEGFSTDKNNVYRERFLHLWQAMLPIYNRLRETLKQDGFAYSGMLCREVATSDITTLAAEKSKKYVFIGFNALSGAEHQLMRQLKDACLADFCWDYTHPFLRDPDNRASLFIHHNGLENAPYISATDNVSTNLPDITLIEISSETGQAAVVNNILQQIASEGIEDWTTTGIILPDEHLLTTVKNAIPACVKQMNITMGQSLFATPILSLLQHLSEIQLLTKKQGEQILFYYQPVLALLSHPYISANVPNDDIHEIRYKMQKANMTYVSQLMFAKNELLNLIFTSHENTNDIICWLQQILQMLVTTDTDNSSDSDRQNADADLRNEYIYQTLLLLNKLRNLLAAHRDVQLTGKTLFSVLIGLVSMIRIPFEGEPLAGMQIMGMLESRGMAFDNLIITDVNDDILPGTNMQQTYIPYDLRRAYGLPTPERQDAVFAYNFYRLISGAKRVWFIQNTTSNDMRSGETSRYINQLEYQYNLPIKKISVNTVPSAAETAEHIVVKDKIVMSEILATLCSSAERKQSGLSASALNTYVSCPLRFYLTYIKHLRESDKITEYIEANKFGDIIHKIMQCLYEPYEGGRTVDVADIDHMLQKINTTSLAEKIYRETLFNNTGAVLEGKDFLHIHVIKQYITNILKYDRSISPFTYLASEVECKTGISIDGVELQIKGIIDRLDITDTELRIIDYKTGEAHSVFKDIETLYSHTDAPNSDHVRQTLFYCLLLKNTMSGYSHTSDNRLSEQLSSVPADCNITPHIYYVRQHDDKIDKEICTKELHGYNAMSETYEKTLCSVLSDILNPTIPFVALPEDNKCKSCPFIQICR